MDEIICQQVARISLSAVIHRHCYPQVQNPKAWIRHQMQPCKKLYQLGDEGGECSTRSQRITFFDKKVTLKGCSSITDRDNQGGCNMHVGDRKSNEFWTKTRWTSDQKKSKSLQRLAKQDQDPIPTRGKQRRKPKLPSSEFERSCETASWRHGQACKLH